MKVYIIAAASADGFIAKTANELIDWTSPEDKKFFREMTKKSGVIIMGSNTYKTFKNPLPNRRNIIITHGKINHPGAESTKQSPAELIARLKKEGYSEVAIAGGSSIYTQFLNAGLVTEIYLTIEPILFGQGLSLFNSDKVINLELIDYKMLSQNTMLMHYGIIK